MPLYRITMETEYEDTIEEIWHAWRASYNTRTVEVEAEDEETAIELAQDGDGRIINEDWDYGDITGSDYHETGECVDSNHIEERITLVETVEDHRIRIEELERQRQQGRRDREATLSRMRTVLFDAGVGRTKAAVVPSITNPPDWEV